MTERPLDDTELAAGDEALLRGPDGVDPAWYRTTYPDIGLEIDPVLHYARSGWRERRSPNQEFSSNWYLRTHSDVADANVNPLLHFLQQGRAQGRSSVSHESGRALAQLEALGGIDADWYRTTYGLERGTNAAAHYVERGWKEGKDPHPDFSTAWYLGNNPDVADAGVNPFVHYLAHGRSKGRSPKPTLVDTLRIKGWWWKLAPPAAIIYATAYQVNVSIAALTPMLLLALAAVSVQAVYVSLINDLSDWSEDFAVRKRNGLFGKSSTSIVAMLLCCIMAGVLFSALLWRHDAVLAGLYIAGWITFSAYSLRPIRLKTRGVWGVIADAGGAHLFPALFAAGLVYHWQAMPVDPIWMIAVGVWSFCYGLRGILWHQQIDCGKDAAAGLRTFTQRHSLRAVRRAAHGIIFPCEIAALVSMFWIVQSPVASGLAALYFIVKWFRSWRFEPPIIVVPTEGNAAARLEPRLALFSYYEFFLPLTFLLASSLRYPADLLVLVIHMIVLSPRTLLPVLISRLSLLAPSVLLKYPRLRIARQ